MHFYVLINHLVMKINSLPNRYSLYHIVTVPTHKLGHTLDIAMFMPIDGIVCLTTATRFFRLIITVLSVYFLQSNLVSMNQMIHGIKQ